MTFFFPHDVMTYRFAVGHEVVEKKAKVARPWPIGRAGHPVGGVVSTVVDLLKYARFHMSDGSGLLKPETIKLMQTPIVTATGLDVMGLELVHHPDRRVRPFCGMAARRMASPPISRSFRRGSLPSPR